MNKKKAIEELGFIQDGRFKDTKLDALDNHLAAFGIGAGRDFSYEHLDEVMGFIGKLKGEDYKTKRDGMRDFYKYVKKEYPASDMAGRAASIFLQAYLTGGLSLGAKGVALLLSRYGLKPLTKVAPKLVRYINESPRVKTFIENVAEAGANVIGEAKETPTAGEVISNPSLLISAATPVLGKGVSKAYQKYLANPTSARLYGQLQGLSAETRKWIRDNYEGFFPKRAAGEISEDRILRNFTDFLDDLSGSMNNIRLKAEAHLTHHRLPNNRIEKYVDDVNETILGLYKQKGLDSAKKKYGQPSFPGDGLEDVRVEPIFFMNLKKMLSKEKGYDGTKYHTIDDIEDFMTGAGRSDTYRSKVLKELLELREGLLGNLKRVTENGEIPSLTEIQVKDWIKKIDHDFIDWGSSKIKDLGKKDKGLFQNTMKNLRGRINERLKEGNKKYKEAIVPYAKLLDIMESTEEKGRKGIKELFGLKNNEGRFEIDDEAIAINKLVELAFDPKKISKARKIWREFLGRAQTIVKADKGSKGNLKSIMDKFQKDLTQGIFDNPTVSADRLNEVVKQLNHSIKKEFPTHHGKADKLKPKLTDMMQAVGAMVAPFIHDYGIAADLASVAMTINVIRNVSKGKGGASIGAINWIAEAEKIKKALQKNPEKTLTELGIPETYWKLEGFAPEATRAYGDIFEKEKKEEITPYKEKESDYEETPMKDSLEEIKKEEQSEDSEIYNEAPMTKIENESDENTFADLPEMFGAPPKEEMRSPAHTGKLEPIEETEELEVVPNPEEKDRADREEKVQSFLDQQLGGKVGKRKYA